MNISNFYLALYVILGVLLALTGLMTRALHNDPLAVPFWWHKWMIPFNLMSMSVFITAIGFSLIEFGFKYMLISLGEVLLGTLVAGLIRQRFGYYLVFISPVLYVILTGALFKLWYIEFEEFSLIMAGVFGVYLYIINKGNGNDSQLNKPSNQTLIVETSRAIEEVQPSGIHDLEKFEKPAITPFTDNLAHKNSRSSKVWLILSAGTLTILILIYFANPGNAPEKFNNINSSSLTASDKNPQTSNVSHSIELCSLSVGDKCINKRDININGHIILAGSEIFITSDTDGILSLINQGGGNFFEFVMNKKDFSEYL